MKGLVPSFAISAKATAKKIGRGREVCLAYEATQIFSKLFLGMMR